MEFKLEKGEDLCLSEYFSDKTLVVYEINSDEKIGVEIFDSDDKLKINKVNIDKIKNKIKNYKNLLRKI